MKFTSRSSLLPLALLMLVIAPFAARAADQPAIQPAQPANTVEPKYPYLQRRAETAAEVTVTFTVDTQGKVAGAKIAQSSNSEFNEATLAAIGQWTFTPALKDGVPVAAKLQQTFVFSVRDLPEVTRKELVAAKKNAR